jgi:hypothetical protein
MAPELALAALDRVASDAIVLDPMCGSGTVLRHAREQGKTAFGYDIDPLAVLIARVTCTRVCASRLRRAAERLVDAAQRTPAPRLPWLDEDSGTRAFVDFWFDGVQQTQLRALAAALHGSRGKVADALRVALSRTIITKDAGASRARDVSHSRPHRVRTSNDYDVYRGFLTAVERIAPLLDTPGSASVSVSRRDARRLPPSLRGKVDLVLTSPPYLNAIDYMRGHRMSLVWLGYPTRELTRLRSESVGAERFPDAGSSTATHAARYRGLTARQQGMLDRYAADIDTLAGQLAQVLSPRGEAVLVVGDSTLSGTYVQNSRIVRAAAERHGLLLTDRQRRVLPTSSRYLPPPGSSAGPLSKRMREEVVMRFSRSAVGSSR